MSDAPSTIETDTLDDGPVHSRAEAEKPAIPVALRALPARYEDLGLLAEGSFGEVRRVRDTLLQRIVAMKILRTRHGESRHVRSRFLVEAQITAGLQHPGIVALYDRGQLPDGRLWFTMREVRGRTLQEIIHEVHEVASTAGFRETASGWTFRRLVDTFARVCQAVAYAHRRGVVHRDLKPENLMIGELGDALVMDWGLARRVGELDPLDDPESLRSSAQENPQLTRHGDVLGTPAYMPPEQARGELALHGFPSDVYALGAVLYHVLAGHPPYRGESAAHVVMQVLAGAPEPVLSAAGGKPLPAELVAICERAMAREIRARHADAEVLAAEVVAWLDGARRREQALSMVAEARALEPEIASLRADAAEKRSEAHAKLDGVRPFEPVERKVPGWALADEAKRLEVRAALREAEWLQTLQGALTVDPDLPEAHAALAEHYKAALLLAERAQRDADVVRAEAALRVHDRGQHVALLRGEGALTLLTEPSSARVRLYRYEEENRRLVPRFVEEIGPTPIVEKRVLKGSYLCVIQAEGHEEVRYPVLIERGGHWDGVPPGERGPRPIALPAEGELLPGEVYVPAGWCWVGGDPEAGDSLPSRRLWVDGFAIGRHPVTCAEYLLFLNDLVDTGYEAEALRACPRRELGAVDTGEVMPVLRRAADGRFVLPPDWAPDLPMVLVDWHAAMAYARWMAMKTGRPIRLPGELEREKAARGADGRFFPWGNQMDGTFACVPESHQGLPQRAVVGAYPVDESAYGVRGLAGNVRDWCLNVWKLDGPAMDGGRVLLDPAAPEDPDFRAIRGGAWGAAMANGRAAARFAARPERTTLAVGLRIARAWPGS